MKFSWIEYGTRTKHTLIPIIPEETVMKERGQQLYCQL